MAYSVSVTEPDRSNATITTRVISGFRHSAICIRKSHSFPIAATKIAEFPNKIALLNQKTSLVSCFRAYTQKMCHQHGVGVFRLSWGSGLASGAATVSPPVSVCRKHYSKFPDILRLRFCHSAFHIPQSAFEKSRFLQIFQFPNKRPISSLVSPFPSLYPKKMKRAPSNPGRAELPLRQASAPGARVSPLFICRSHALTFSRSLPAISASTAP